MTQADTRGGSNKPERVVRAPQSLAAGLVLMGLAALAMWLVRDLDSGSLEAMGSGLLPRALACTLGFLGFVLVVSAFLRNGLPIERTELQGPVLILLAIVSFALTIRPFALGPVTTPGLGLIVAAPLAIMISGFATQEARLREVVALALGLTPFCMLLFGDLLNLPVPIFPASLLDSFPDGWSQKAMLRIASAIMLAAATVVVFVGRTKPDVAHQGEQV